MHRLALVLLAATLLPSCSSFVPPGSYPAPPAPSLATILEERRLGMHAKQPPEISLAEARNVPSLVDAAHALPNVVGLPAPTIEVKQFAEPTAIGAQGPLPAALYRPALAKNTPIIVFFPSGTWATGNPVGADETARQLAARTGWVVLLVRPRLAPEVKFPAQHEDAMAAYQWARSRMRAWGADPTRVVLAGMGPGANLALSTALLARNSTASGRAVPLPDHLLLITPWSGTATDTPSMSAAGNTQPLSRATIRWAQHLYAPDNLRDPRIDLASRADFAGLPPTTMILAQIDPFLSQSEALAARMRAAGVPVEARLYPGMTYDFFGLGAYVPEAALAEEYTADRLRVALPDPELAPPRHQPRRSHRRR